MKTKLTVVLTVTLIYVLSPVFGQWERRNIDASVAYTCFVDVDDMDGDGDMDVVVSEYGANMIRLYKNNNLAWTMQDIGYLDGLVGLDIADFDNDGKLDVAAAAWQADAVVWYKNNGGNPITWTKNTIDNTLDGAEVVYAEDIDGDGAVDAVANAYNSGEVVWYKNNLPAGWTKYNIGSKISGDANIDVSDINDDGKPDIVKASANSNRVILYKNNLPDVNWTEIIIDKTMYGTFMANIGDIDNDGDMDIAAAAQNATGSSADVAWYENDGNEQTWTKHTISTDLLKARCLYIVDIDNNGYMDIVVNDIDANDVILFINEDGGQNWIEYIIDNNYNAVNAVFAYDIDLDGDFDIFPSSRVDNALVWYENNWVNYAYGHSPEVYPQYNQSLSDTLTIRARMYNPEGNPANVYAIIKGDQSAFTDTIQLFDDGLHADNDSSDNTWANIRLSQGLLEDLYVVELMTHDLNLDTVQYYHRHARFTTIGPVVVEGYTFTGTDTIPDPGDDIYFEITLRNYGSTATATDIEANLSVPDTNVSFKQFGSRGYGDISPGETSTTSGYCKIQIGSDYPYDTEIPVHVDITSNGYSYWRDTFYIPVHGPVNIKEIIEPITRIYPNPTNDILNIEISNTCKQGLEIEIFSITGALIYQKEYKNINAHFSEQIDLSGYTKGIYLVKVMQADAIYVKKVVVR
jgi:hypothetical protein